MQDLTLSQFELNCALRNMSKGTANGMLVNSDNAVALPCIEQQMRGKVKCVYLDPPYANGDCYEHYQDNLQHDAWMNSIAEVLPYAMRLLSEDGSVWISIDDAEQAYLKVLCDTLFGRDRFVANIVWEHRTTRENRSAFSHNHEYILVYAKNPERFKVTRKKISAPRLAKAYKNPDDDPRGLWQSVTATAQAGHSVESQFYKITSPLTGKIHTPPKGRCWVYNESRMKAEIAANNIWFGSDGNGVPRIKKFLTDASCTVVPETLWKADDVGTTQDAKRHVLSLSGNKTVFETPKPESLLARIIEIATDAGDVVVDAYLGSGTSAAVAHKLNRRYIGIEANPSAFELAGIRLKKVIAGERGGISQDINWHGGGSCQLISAEDCSNVMVPNLIIA